MQPKRSPVKSLAVMCAVALCVGALPLTYAEDGRGHRHSHGAARWDQRTPPRAHRESAPTDRRMGNEHRRQTDTWRPRQRETIRAPAQSGFTLNAPRHHAVPEHRPVHVSPAGHQIVIHRGAHFHFHQGVWYRSHGARFIRVAAPLGAVVHFLPHFHSRIWFYTVPFPYYFANNVYYIQSPQGYVVAEPPPQQIIQEEPANGTKGSNVTEEPADSGELNETRADQLYVYPRQGQSQQQLDQDRSECRSWAAGQTGYGMPSASAPSSDTVANYERAQSACLEGRGYTVR